MKSNIYFWARNLSLPLLLFFFCLFCLFVMGWDAQRFISYGFSELYEKESADAARSGFGFELVLRLLSEDPARDAVDSQPPVWPVNLMQVCCKISASVIIIV